MILSNNNLLMVLSRQFKHSWALLLQAINSNSDDRWGEVLSHDKEDYWVFSLTVYHILETTDFYMQFSPDSMEWGQKGQIDWESQKQIGDKINKLTKSLILQYLDEIEEKFGSILSLTPVSQLFKADGFSWFPCVLDKYLYLLRHNMMHIGELNKSLRDWRYPRISWE
jgi:hypothetical protein